MNELPFSTFRKVTLPQYYASVNYQSIHNNELEYDNSKMTCAPSKDSPCASMQSDQRLHCPHEEALGPCFIWSAKERL